MKYLIALSNLIFLYAIGCSDKAKNNMFDLNYVLAQNKADTFVKKIPIVNKDEYSSVYYNVKEFEKDFKLSSIENGIDSIEIRFWYGYNIGDTLQCLRVFNLQNEWHGELITTYYTRTDNKNSRWEITNTVQKKYPRRGWDTFINKIVGLGIITLPDASNIPDYSFATHARVLIVEIATKKFYRLYSYEEPLYNSKRIKEAKSIEQIIEIIEDEFRFRMLQKI